MIRPRYSHASFAVNRWQVGCHSPASADLEAAAERDRLAQQRRNTKLKASRAKALIRPRLWQQNPHCTRCGQLLQIENPSSPMYACVVRDRLACRRCVAAVQLLADHSAEFAAGVVR